MICEACRLKVVEAFTAETDIEETCPECADGVRFMLETMLDTIEAIKP